jgi:ATP-dependent DNA ligase
MYLRGKPYFYAFDILQLKGQDLRSFPLLTRKRHPRRLIPKAGSPLLAGGEIRSQPGQQLDQDQESGLFPDNRQG